MRAGILYFGFLTVLTLSANADEPKRESAEEARTKLQGDWVLQSFELGDTKLIPVNPLGAPDFIVKKEKCEYWRDGKVQREDTWKVDPSKDPKVIDFTILDGKDKGKDTPGIYKLEGDLLTLCRAAPGMERPTRFDSKASGGLFVYKRAKK